MIIGWKWISMTKAEIFYIYFGSNLTMKNYFFVWNYVKSFGISWKKTNFRVFICKISDKLHDSILRKSWIKTNHKFLTLELFYVREGHLNTLMSQPAPIQMYMYSHIMFLSRKERDSNVIDYNYGSVY